MKQTLILSLMLVACDWGRGDADQTSSAGDSTASATDTGATTTDTEATTGGAACEPPSWFECPGTAICDVVDCNAPLGLLYENGCERPACNSTEDCNAGERCIEITVAGFCQSSGVFCEMDGDQCLCGGSDDCTFGSRCVAEADAAANDCPVADADCSTLVGWSEMLSNAYLNRLEWMHAELAESLSSCAQQVEDKILADDALCDLSLCYEACRLHPCEPNADCQEQCEQAAANITDEQLRTIVSNAAKTPGMCTCDVCESDSFAFCEALWGCNMGG